METLRSPNERAKQVSTNVSPISSRTRSRKRALENLTPSTHFLHKNCNLPESRKKRPNTSKAQSNARQFKYSGMKLVGPNARSSLVQTRKKRCTSSNTEKRPQATKSKPIRTTESEIESGAHFKLGPNRKKRCMTTKIELGRKPSWNRDSKVSTNFTEFWNSLKNEKKPATSSAQGNSRPNSSLGSKDSKSTPRSSLKTQRKMRSTTSTNVNLTAYPNTEPHVLESTNYEISSVIGKGKSVTSRTQSSSHLCPDPDLSNSEPIVSSSLVSTRKRYTAVNTQWNSKPSTSLQPDVLQSNKYKSSLISRKKESVASSTQEHSNPSSKGEVIESPTKCSVCLDTSKCRKMKFLPCGHSFHEKCIDQWLYSNDKCPICRCPSSGQVDNDNSGVEVGGVSAMLVPLGQTRQYFTEALVMLAQVLHLLPGNFPSI